jgi:hypothetical protein
MPRRAPLLIVFSFTAACGFDEPAPLVRVDPNPTPPVEMEEPPPPTAIERLSRGLALELESNTSAVEISVAHAQQGEPSRVTVQPSEGRIGMRVRQDSVLASSGIRIDVDDIDVSAEAFPPNGLHLTNLHGEVTFTEIDATWVDAQHATFGGTARIRIEWSLVTKDSVLPIRPLDIAQAMIEGELSVDAYDRVHVTLRGRADGQIFEVVGASIKDLALDFAFSEPIISLN